MSMGPKPIGRDIESASDGELVLWARAWLERVTMVVLNDEERRALDNARTCIEALERRGHPLAPPAMLALLHAQGDELAASERAAAMLEAHGASHPDDLIEAILRTSGDPKDHVTTMVRLGTFERRALEDLLTHEPDEGLAVVRAVAERHVEVLRSHSSNGQSTHDPHAVRGTARDAARAAAVLSDLMATLDQSRGAQLSDQQCAERWDDLEHALAGLAVRAVEVCTDPALTMATEPARRQLESFALRHLPTFEEKESFVRSTVGSLPQDGFLLDDLVTAALAGSRTQPPCSVGWMDQVERACSLSLEHHRGSCLPTVAWYLMDNLYLAKGPFEREQTVRRFGDLCANGTAQGVVGALLASSIDLDARKQDEEVVRRAARAGDPAASKIIAQNLVLNLLDALQFLQQDHTVRRQPPDRVLADAIAFANQMGGNRLGSAMWGEGLDDVGLSILHLRIGGVARTIGADPEPYHETAAGYFTRAALEDPSILRELAQCRANVGGIASLWPYLQHRLVPIVEARPDAGALAMEVCRNLAPDQVLANRVGATVLLHEAIEAEQLIDCAEQATAMDAYRLADALADAAHQHIAADPAASDALRLRCASVLRATDPQRADALLAEVAGQQPRWSDNATLTTCVRHAFSTPEALPVPIATSTRPPTGRTTGTRRVARPSSLPTTPTGSDHSHQSVVDDLAQDQSNRGDTHRTDPATLPEDRRPSSTSDPRRARRARDGGRDPRPPFGSQGR